MFNNINNALESLACKGAVLETYPNGDQLIDMKIRNRNSRLIVWGGSILVSTLVAGVGAAAELMKNR